MMILAADVISSLVSSEHTVSLRLVKNTIKFHTTNFLIAYLLGGVVISSERNFAVTMATPLSMQQSAMVLSSLRSSWLELGVANLKCTTGDSSSPHTTTPLHLQYLHHCNTITITSILTSVIVCEEGQCLLEV